MEINRGKGNKIVGGGGRGGRGGRPYRGKGDRGNRQSNAQRDAPSYMGNVAGTSPINLHPSSNSEPIYKENQVPAHQNQQRFNQEPFNGVLWLSQAYTITATIFSISRSSSCSNEPSNNFNDLNLPTTSDTKYESRHIYSNRIKYSRERRQRIGDKGPLAELSCDHYASGYFDTREYPCAEPVEVEVPFCHHKVTIPCHTRFYPECNLPCDKRLDCGHSCEQICHEHNDPEHLDYGCVEPCALLNKGCSSDHKCLLRCFEECKPCTEMVIRELPCGHSLKVLCSADLSTIACQQKCSRTLACQHPCVMKCFQECEPCQVPVTKKVLGCGHTMEVACSTAATRQMCEGRCSNKLSCGHQCGKRCMDTCNSNDCKQPVKVEKPMLCGHTEAHVPCNNVSQVPKMTPETLLQYCTKPCGKELMCTHACSGTCSECMQGRIHKLCNEQCGNVLICGHSCKVPCREACPPCMEPCRHECKHSKCNRTCGEECVPCKEPCDYACPHMQCSRRCGEMCDRDPCYEPCPQPLSCGHSCTGFCGEPCPPCRKCKPEHFEEIFFLGEETEEDSKWVQMVDCGHTVESTGLEVWLNMDQDSGEIGCKVCPRCKTPIVKVQRFMNLMKQTYLDIQSVKAKCIEKQDEIKAESAKASRKIQYVVYIHMATDNVRPEVWSRGGRTRGSLLYLSHPVPAQVSHSKLNQRAVRPEVWSRGGRTRGSLLYLSHPVPAQVSHSKLYKRAEPVHELEKMFRELKVELPKVKGETQMRNRFRKLAVLCFWTEFFMSVYKRKKEAWPSLNKESKSLLNSKINFLTWYLMKRRQTISKQEMEGFECEVKRVHRMIDLFLYTSSWKYRMAESVAQETKQVAERLIFSINAYDKELDDKVKETLNKLKEQIKSSTDVTDEERYVINKASYLSFHSWQKSGYWFKCKKGHLYCIAECGGAMEESVCPIRGCGERIGGYNRR